MDIKELRHACEVANARTEEKIKARKKSREKAQVIAMIIMFGLTTIYWK